MIIKSDGWNLVLLGKWNKYILSPEWTAENIFQVDGVQVEFSINLDRPHRYTSDTVRMIPGEDSVVFIPIEFDNETLSRLEQCATRLFGALPYTPVGACGINYAFSERTENLPESVSNLFVFEDTGRLRGNGEIQEAAIRRTILLNNKKINFSIVQNEENVAFDFNFHYDIAEASHAGKLLEGEVARNKDMALEILSQYGLTLEEEEE